MYSAEDIEELFRLGRALSIILETLLQRIKPGAGIGPIVDECLLLTRKAGLELAFPPNVSVNQIAAHDTADICDSRVLPNEGLVKLDIGVAKGGLLTDCARTVALGAVEDKLVVASEEALLTAIKTTKPGVRLRKIGEAIHRTVKSHGLRSVRNLVGHEIIKGSLHTGTAVPNNKTLLSGYRRVKLGETYAIEPFVTTGGLGLVVEAKSKPLIYEITHPPRTSLGRQLFKRWGTSPFSGRPSQTYIEFDQDEFYRTCYLDNFRAYPPLVERTGRWVAQSEDTILVTQDGVEVLTYGRGW